MSRLTALLCGAALAVLAGPAAAQEKNSQKPAGTARKDRPEVEVVFCLDTTGSMGGLINAAKQKIWAICNQIAGGKPTPRLKVGLVAYRDRGDAYVTKVFDLTDDLDAVHSNLMGFQAAGGGDFPESVNQALHESVTKIGWSKNKKALKIIFLVGDAPPHMDYANDVKYPETCKLAASRDIIINTIQCGTHAETRKYWQEICRLAEGAYVQIDARGGPVVTINTPFDKDLAQINTELARSTLTYGRAEARSKGDAKRKAAAALPVPAAADRAAFAGKAKMAASYDLLDAIKAGTVKLKELKKDELPAEMQKMTLEEQEAHLTRIDKARQELNARAVELDRKRSAYIAQKLREQGKNQARDSFEGQVLLILQRQAVRANIRYETADDGKKQK
jgi:Mg-chelatase subunit ChlD